MHMSRRARLLPALALILVPLAGCASRSGKAVPLIARDVLFGNPEKSSPQISPDGTRLAYLAPRDGVMNVWVGPVDEPEAARPVTHDTNRGIRSYFWAYTNQHIVYVQDKGGDENWRVYVVDLATNEARDLTPIEGVQARIQEVSPQHPDVILVGLNDRVPQFHDLYRINIRTGERTPAHLNQGFAGFITDPSLRVRLAVRMTPDGGAEFFERVNEAWEPFATISAEDSMTTTPIAVDATGRRLYMIDSRGRNTAALVEVDLQTDASRVLAEDPRADVRQFMAHPQTRTIQAAGANYLRTQWQFFDLRVAADIDVLRSLGDGDVDVVSRSYDDQQWIVVIHVDDGPVRYYHFDRQARKPRYLFSNRPALEKLSLARMHPVEIKARDGRTLVSYLSLPPWTDRDGDGRPARPLPMVLLVHGGPWGRDAWGYNPYHQWLANRGYAVLSVNFRGSTGFGKEHVNAGDRQWGAAMHDDLLDAVEWAVEQGVAERREVAIMGGSYGGYAALVGLTFTPEVFVCGVDIVGPSNLITLLESIPPYWKPIFNMFSLRVGDPTTEEGRKLLTDRSPLSRVDQITKPLLIAQGANDPRVKQAESDQIVQAMQARNIPVTYVLFPDEGHGFARPENNLAFHAVAEAFLAQHLGGRVEPVGDDFEGSSIRIPHGAEFIPGLPVPADEAPASTSAPAAGGIKPMVAE